MALIDDYRDALRDARVIRLIGNINDDMLKDFYKSIDQLLAKTEIEGKKVFFTMSSSGGHVMNAMVMHQEMRCLDGLVEIHTVAMGLICSSIVYPFLAARKDRRIATATSRFYLHRHVYSMEFKLNASVDEHDRLVREYTVNANDVVISEKKGAELIADATGLSFDKVMEMRSQVTSFGPREALLHGFIHEIMQ